MKEINENFIETDKIETFLPLRKQSLKMRLYKKRLNKQNLKETGIFLELTELNQRFKDPNNYSNPNLISHDIFTPTHRTNRKYIQLQEELEKKIEELQKINKKLKNKELK